MAYKIGMVSLGCSKNQVDAEIMMAKLKAEGYELVAEAGLSDVAIVNTCGFIESAKNEAIEEILELAKLKEEGRIKAIIVTGCLAERYREEVANELPETDAVIGIGANETIVDVVNRVLKGERVMSFPEKTYLPLSGDRVQTTPYYTSYIKVAEGCDNRCTYCAIPYIRGKFRSRTIEDIMEEAKRLAKNGIKEVNVIAQDTTRYGQDLYGKYMLPELLKQLCTVDGIEWIRVLYCYPDKITDELIEVMATEDKIVKYIDLPLQHCNDTILKRMNRRGDKAFIQAVLDKLRKAIPEITIRTTFIVGFPGETDEQFAELHQFVKDNKFERMGCFTYSAEDGTPAATFEDQIEQEVKDRREELIMETQMEIMDVNSEKQIGKTIKVLVEGYDKLASAFFGRATFDAPDIDCKVFFTSKTHKVSEGAIVDVKVTDYMDSDLIGEQV